MSALALGSPLLRLLCGRSLTRGYHSLIHSSIGNPAEVLTYNTSEQRHPNELPHRPPSNEPYVQVAPLLTSLNTADLNTISGTYPVKPSFMSGDRSSPGYVPYSIPGSEFVGIVRAVSGPRGELKVGDLVIPNETALGSMTSLLPFLPESSFTAAAAFFSPLSTEASSYPDPLSPPPSSLLSRLLSIQVNPSTAYRMLHDFPPPSSSSSSSSSSSLPLYGPGDVLLVSGGLSAVSTAFASLAHSLFPGVSLVATVRRPDAPLTSLLADPASTSPPMSRASYLRSVHGFAAVVSEESLQSRTPRALLDAIAGLDARRVPLALDCVGGSVGSNLLLALSKGGTHVTYGGLSLEPLRVRASNLIFKDVRLRGFWLTEWMKEQQQRRHRRVGGEGGDNNREEEEGERTKMLKTLGLLVQSGKLKLPSTEIFDIRNSKEAVGRVGRGVKVAIDCTEEGIYAKKSG